MPRHRDRSGLEFIAGVIGLWLRTDMYYGRATANITVGSIFLLPTIYLFPLTTISILGILTIGGVAYAVSTGDPNQRRSRSLGPVHERESPSFEGFYSQSHAPRPYRSSGNSRRGGGDIPSFLRKIEPGEVIPVNGEFISASSIRDLITTIFMRYGISETHIQNLFALADSHKDFVLLQKDPEYAKIIVEISKNMKHIPKGKNKTRSRRSSSSALVQSTLIE